MARKPNSGSFTPGQSGNPGGKPVNARNSLTAAFLRDLAADFETNGKTAIEAARVADPTGYVRVVASLLPKEMIIERPLEALSDDEILALITELRGKREGETATSSSQGDATKH